LRASRLVMLACLVSALLGAVGPLPGLRAKPCWKQDAGYLPVSDGKQLYYWYHEATEDPSSKPWMLWLNGGPGCSSLGGMFTELGPYVVNIDMDGQPDVTYNPYSWNTIANVIFIEQPAGVGFSYPNGKRDDALTANDTYAALVGFLRQHPELQGRKFYVAGESYGGHYVPNTVRAVQEGNARLPAGSADHINIIGFAVGNGYTDWELDFGANVVNGRYHALTSQSLMLEALDACEGKTARCFWPRADVTCPADCDAAVQAATKHAMDGSIDIYDIYEDVCLPDSASGAVTERLATQTTTLLAERARARVRQQQAHGRRAQTTISPVFPTCIDASVKTYLNMASVQAVIGVNRSTIPNGAWSDCGNVDYDFNYASELSNYEKWMAEGELQMLIYNGDADYILSHMGNAAWIDDGLKLNKTAEWTAWRGSDGQVAGYFETYATAGVPFTFLTVKGAGHMVPKDRPRHALDMLGRFLAGGEYDQVARQKGPVKPLCPVA